MAIDPSTPAGLRSLRDHLGLTGEQLGRMLGVDPRAILRWEDGSVRIPDAIATELDALQRRTQTYVADLAGQIRDGTALVYRTDAEVERATGTTMPASWYRMAIARAAALLPDPVTVVYPGDQGDGQRQQAKLRRRQARALDSASRHRQPFTDADLEVLRSDLSHQDAAARLGRSLWSVRAKRSRMASDAEPSRDGRQTENS